MNQPSNNSTDNQLQALPAHLQRFWDEHPQALLASQSLQEEVGYSFQNLSLLAEALTHRSAVVDFDVALRKVETPASNTNISWNERLEFLGDSVLSLVITNYIWTNRREMTEGGLSRFRASLVNEATLAEIARSIQIANCIALGRGEKLAEGQKRDSLLADALESLIGAVFLDGGFEQAKTMVENLFYDLLQGDWQQMICDYKTQLQELIQEESKQTPTYELLASSGPDHEKTFEVMVLIDGKETAVGSGLSKKRASQNAAKRALEIISRSGDDHKRGSHD